ncbi:hypothetical protein C4D60_Mb07t18170 [Musa balbisiana]|uniref:S1 motif domain-containing protein n=1 Tax=Musa balbisiana TaxID=52838 RepID=A0A4S8JIN1_MUSBA|nr:hypothetical protein C4D60_Mb07t18170 [Musa balbisiana]
MGRSLGWGNDAEKSDAHSISWSNRSSITIADDVTRNDNGEAIDKLDVQGGVKRGAVGASVLLAFRSRGLPLRSPPAFPFTNLLNPDLKSSDSLPFLLLRGARGGGGGAGERGPEEAGGPIPGLQGVHGTGVLHWLRRQGPGRVHHRARPRSETVVEFDAKLKVNGAQMPDYFVRALLTIIHAILPPRSKASKPPPYDPRSQSKKKASARIANPKDVVKRDQEVYVKVISVSGQKLSLSTRDVDQKTGNDLLPMKKSSEDGAPYRVNPASGDGGGTRSSIIRKLVALLAPLAFVVPPTHHLLMRKRGHRRIRGAYRVSIKLKLRAGVVGHGRRNRSIHGLRDDARNRWWSRKPLHH